jgi:DNA modification methylase
MNKLPSEFVNKLICGDGIEGMRRLRADCIPLTVTSPPYDEIRTYGGHAFDFESMAGELWRVTAPGGVLVWVVQDQTPKGNQTGTSFRHALFFKDLGFRLHQTLVMQKFGRRSPCLVRYDVVHEYAFVFSKGKPHTINLIHDKPNSTAGAPVRNTGRSKDGTLFSYYVPDKVIKPYGTRGSIWSYVASGGNSTKDREAYEHPALMPEAMAEDHIISWSRPGDLVLDPMAGAATTCKMAMFNHRKYLGFEIHRPYFDIGVRRLESARAEYLACLEQELFV